MSLDSILNGVIADAGAGDAVIAFSTLESMKNDFDKMFHDFKTSHVNFERMMHEHNQLKERAGQLEAQRAQLLIVQGKQNQKILEQQRTIAGLRSQLHVHGMQVDDELRADAAGDSGSDWFTVESTDEDRSGDAARIGPSTTQVDVAVDGLLLLHKRNAKRKGLDTESNVVKKTPGTQRALQHTASVDEVVHAFLTSLPMYGVSGWRFKDTDSAREFWTAVYNETVYQPVDEKQRLKSAKKTLNAIGYDVPHSQDCWTQALSWGWDCVRAIKNCYWLNTTVQLDWKVKKMLQVLKQHYTEDARASTPSLDAPVDFPDLLQQTQPFVSKLFVCAPKHKETLFEKRKMQEIVVICKLLKCFHQQGRIAEVSVFRPWVAADGDVRAALLEKLRECVSAPEQADAP